MQQAQVQQQPQEQQEQQLICQADALPILLHHPSICQDQGLICRLLATSKAMRVAIHQSCQGLVPVSVSITGAAKQAAAPPGSCSCSSAASSSIVHTPRLGLSSFSKWVAQHGILLKQLELHNNESMFVSHAPACIGMALVYAAASASAAEHNQAGTGALTSPLKLQAVTLTGCAVLVDHLPTLPVNIPATSSILPSILAALPTDSITSLHSTCGSQESCIESCYASQLQLHASQAKAGLLQRLTQLRSLALQGQEAGLLLPCVTALTNLTRLQLMKLPVSAVAALQHLPATSLKSLDFSVSPNIHGWQRKQLQPQLGYLTALTELSCTGEGLFAVQVHDILPPALRELTVVDCPSPQPLLPLSQLQVLQMNASTMPAAGLLQLSTALQQLHTVRLCYDRDAAVVASASAGWASLPVCSLELRVYPGPVTWDTIQHMRQLTSLSHLAIQGFDVRFEATCRQFAGVLQHLTQLCELKLASLKLMPDEVNSAQHALAPVQGAVLASAGPLEPNVHARLPAASPAAHLHGHFVQLDPTGAAARSSADKSTGMCALLCTIASLPQLQNFGFIRFDVSSAAAVELAAATQLTCLRLDECDLLDDAVAGLLGSLRQLKRLSLNWNFQLGQKVVEVIGQHLQQLQELSLCSTKVSSSDCEQLKQHLPALKFFL